MDTFRYPIFGDLHGRILPAFRLAMRGAREYGLRLDGLLQVGDLGYFPDISRLDKATAQHAVDAPRELGTSLVVEPNREAGEVFHERRRAASDSVVHGGKPRGLRRPRRS